MITNFRDLGGLKTRNNQTVKSNRLLRSGELYQLNENDIKLLRKHQLTKIVDFRSEREISEHPDTQLEGTSYLHIDLLGSTDTGSASLDDFVKLDDFSQVSSYMETIYKELILDESVQNGYKRFLNTLMFEHGSTIFHCFAGKDRTGIGAMLILEILGVSREDIYTDYLKTNTSRKQANEQMIAEINKQHSLSDSQKSTLLIALEVKKEYLDSAYQIIDSQFGGIDNYIKEIIGWSKEDIDQFKTYYLN
ncbi:tyrosine-protein phosphatase [Vagococcus vulneris]|uniref:Tyrosine specific protein phosphatases domain-containing protein n=1 Tax=Vagococcus vulneris TaxID=1977869 RepID=A0A429ZWC5_9ENTE|nr:tyrosine-protein phosphatase [Vagococcus vulneris]RST98063.1 hypothetical protein CBF37_09175 [Vagococcus vulneris]